MALASLFENEVGAGGGPLASMAALGALGGLGAGAGSDARVKGRTGVYRDQARAVAIRPLASPGVRGVQLAVRF
jgi:hypothetical protein